VVIRSIQFLIELNDQTLKEGRKLPLLFPRLGKECEERIEENKSICMVWYLPHQGAVAGENLTFWEKLAKFTPPQQNSPLPMTVCATCPLSPLPSLLPTHALTTEAMENKK
jgi:hypothetical protein